MWLAATMQGRASISLGHEPTTTRLSSSHCAPSLCAPGNEHPAMMPAVSCHGAFSPLSAIIRQHSKRSIFLL